MNSINSFTFYRDYYNLIDTISIKDKKDVLCAIVDYIFKDIEPKLSGHNQAIINTLISQLNKSKNNSKRATKLIENNEPNENQKKTKQKPNENQNKTERKPNDIPNDIPNENKTSVLSFIYYINNFNNINNNNILINKLEDWFKYKQERKDKYTNTGIKTLLKKVNDNVSIYGCDKVIDLIEDSIANNYQGIIWDKLKNINTKKKGNINSSIEEIDNLI